MKTIRWIALWIVITLLVSTQSASAINPSFPVAPQSGSTELVSMASDGTQGNASSGAPSISADGRFVAFSSGAINLVGWDINDHRHIYMHDRQTRITERVSVASDGTKGNGYSESPSISADGRFVAFHSYASNLVNGDTNENMDVFVHDRQTGMTERVSVTSDGTQGNSVSEYPSISTDGRFVAFDSYASNLVNGDTNGNMDIFVHDRQTGMTKQVSVASDGTQGNRDSYRSSISADGRFVVFTSEASNLVNGDTMGYTDVFVHDLQTGMTERVSITYDGIQGNWWSGCPLISADGRFVAFCSGASNLVNGDTNENWDVFVYDRQTKITERVSVASDGTQGNERSSVSSISSDGHFVAFESWASNLVNGDTNANGDAFVHDRQTRITERVSVASDGIQGNSFSYSSSISADGDFVAFESNASNLVIKDTNNTMDVFVHTIQKTPVLVKNESGDPIYGAQIFQNGNFVGKTDIHGILNASGIISGDQLIARQMIMEKPTQKANHSQDSAQDWAYRVYITSLDIPKDGDPLPFIVSNPGITQELVIKKNNTLIGFNLFAVVEWDADSQYLSELQKGFRNASAYLYDATDGQMVLERVTITDNALWGFDADYYFQALNNYRPGTGWVVSALLLKDSYNHPYFGRGGNSDVSSIIHEFGHYALGLYDSYFYYDGIFKRDGYCTSRDIRANHTANVNATLMYYSYNSTEFSNKGTPSLWSPECEQTAQWQKTGKSDWEVILDLYKDPNNPTRWVLKSPTDYGGVVAGPNTLSANAWSNVDIANDANTGVCNPAVVYQVTHIWGVPASGADVVLRKSGRDIEQGKTDDHGEITILGASSGDRVIINWMMGADLRINSTPVSCTSSQNLLDAHASNSATQIQLLPAAYQVSLSTLPGSVTNQVKVIVKASVSLPSAPQTSLTQSSASVINVPLTYDAGLQAFVGEVALNPVLPFSGTIVSRALNAQNQVVEISTNFSLDQVDPTQDMTVRSNDGQAEIYLPAGSLSSAGQLNTNLTPLPAALPDKKMLLSGPYIFSASSGTILSSGGNLSLYYLDLGGSTLHANLKSAQIYRFVSGAWQPLDSQPNTSQKVVSAPISSFGTYALLADWEAKIYLPALKR